MFTVRLWLWHFATRVCTKRSSSYVDCSGPRTTWLKSSWQPAACACAQQNLFPSRRFNMADHHHALSNNIFCNYHWIWFNPKPNLVRGYSYADVAIVNNKNIKDTIQCLGRAAGRFLEAARVLLDRIVVRAHCRCASFAESVVVLFHWCCVRATCPRAVLFTRVAST